MTPRIKYIILGLTLYFCRFNANGQIKIQWTISNDSLQNERDFKDVEMELISNCLAVRKLNLECDSVYSNILIDSIVQSMCNLNLSLVKSFSDYDTYINKLIETSYKSIGLSKKCQNHALYDKSRMLLALLYEYKIFKVYCDENNQPQTYYHKYNYDETGKAITLQSDTADILIARLLNKKGELMIRSLANYITNDKNKTCFLFMHCHAFGFRESNLVNLKVQQQSLATEKEKLATSKEKRNKIIFVILTALATGLLIFSIINIFVKKKLIQKINAQKEIIELQSKVVEEKNKDITDSITYARRIQQAKLPIKQEILNSFPQSFVLYKPKDIVSGDFYYFTTNKQGVFIASVDCTGHGVPGAFMSLIGSERLDDAVSQHADTSEILNHLNKGIKASLRQSNSKESTRDGMDIALCSVDVENRIVKYAGANRPIWIIRNGQTEVEEIKATKTAIGGLTDDEHHFDSHEIKLQQGDTFYICTDGYADQFSGQNGKKLMTRKFKEILVNIQSKSMQEQETYLDNFIENWKAGTEQVDDILVIGVRL